VLCLAAWSSRAERDPAEHRRRSDQLSHCGAIAERGPANRGADDRLQVDERARELGGDACLAKREQPEREQRSGDRERRQGDHRPGARRGVGCALGEERDRRGEEGTGRELDCRHRGGVAPLK